MSKKVLIVVDMQNDFITGSLGSKEAEAIVPNVKRKIQEYHNEGYDIIYTRDTHYDDYLNTLEGRNLPVPHCIEGSNGWNIVDGLFVEGSEIINKFTFGYLGWGSRSSVGFNDNEIEEIELCGLCTDICVVSNALILRAMYPDIEITVDSSCCAGVTPEKHESALETMRSCQINVK